jgi:ATP-dependent protease HslVU (ClpYQ) peptidase subunit
MTTIAFDGLILAADSLCCWGNMKESRDAEKLRFVDGHYYAVTGADGMLDALIAWHKAGAKPEQYPRVGETGAQLVVINKTLRACIYYEQDQPYGCAVPRRWAIGTGRDFAMGALHAGANAVDAVRIAANLDTRSGGPVQWFNTNDPVKKGKPARLHIEITYNPEARV